MQGQQWSRKLVKLIAAKAAAATPKEKTLAFTEWQAFAMRPFMGELTLQSFEAHYEEYDKLRNRVGENMRGESITVVQHLSTSCTATRTSAQRSPSTSRWRSLIPAISTLTSPS